jgi:hypothetical protein
MRFWLLAVVVLGGCAGLDDAGCRQADWYDLGFRDAIFGMQPQDGVYARQCERASVKVDAARYLQGWREGRWEADARSTGSFD